MQRASFMRPFGGARSLANAAKHGRANVNFSDFQNAYRPKTTAEIVNSIACFTACEQPWIVKNSAYSATKHGPLWEFWHYRVVIPLTYAANNPSTLVKRQPAALVLVT
jgi:hypothetical protein